MIEKEYIKDINAHYLVIRNIDFEISDYTLKMIFNNKIMGLLPLEIKQIDELNLLYYNITSLMVLDRTVESIKIDYEFLKKIIIGILDIIENSSKYLLNKNNFILNEESIFIEPNDKNINLCYIPGYNINIINQIVGLSEYLLNHINHEDKNAVIAAYGLYKMCREGNCTFSEIKRVIILDESSSDNEYPLKKESERIAKEYTDKVYSRECINNIKNEENIIGLGLKKRINNIKSRNIKKEKVKEVFNNSKLCNYIKIPFSEEKVEDEKEISVYPFKNYIIMCVILIIEIFIYWVFIKFKIVYDDFGNRINIIKAGILFMVMASVFLYLTIALFKKNKKISKIITCKRIIEEDDNSSDKTVLLSERLKNEKYMLIPDDYNKYCKIIINVLPFFIGKDKRQVNFIIEDSQISRIHAKIERLDKVLYITDLNSTNGTYINGVRINSFVAFAIDYEDKIKFANIEYRFTSI